MVNENEYNSLRYDSCYMHLIDFSFNLSVLGNTLLISISMHNITLLSTSVHYNMHVLVLCCLETKFL